MSLRLIDCIGTQVLCPNCPGTAATVRPSRATAKVPEPSPVPGQPPHWVWPERNPHFAIVDCPRCGKTQYPGAKPVEPAPDVVRPEPDPSPDPGPATVSPAARDLRRR